MICFRVQHNDNLKPFELKRKDGICKIIDVLENLCESLLNNGKKQVKCRKNKTPKGAGSFCVCCPVWQNSTLAQEKPEPHTQR